MNHTAPTSLLELVLVGLAIGTVVLAFYLAIRHTMFPDETSPEHIKRRIIEDDCEDPP